MSARNRNSRPLIGVTGADRGSLFAWWCTAIALWLAGARCRWLTPSRYDGAEGLDGFVIGGGADVDPQAYGETRPLSREEEKRAARRTPLSFLWALILYVMRAALRPWRPVPGIDLARDAMELECLRQATRDRLPVLGICRGAQLLNVSLGGSLHQSIDDFYVETPRVRSFLPRKRVLLTPGSRLHRILGEPIVWVNSLHDQSVNRLGIGMRATARESTGVVQAIESEAQRFLVGVQWHPELMPQKKEQRALFRAFVEAAEERLRSKLEDPYRACGRRDSERVLP